MSLELLVIQHLDCEGPDLIASCAAERGMALRCLRPDRGDPLPDPIHSPPAIAVVLGGSMGVNERNKLDLEWLETELQWLHAWHKNKRPVLGICLGAQLLAAAAGGSVEELRVGEPAKQLRELGYGAITWRRNPREESLFKGLDPVKWCCIGMGIGYCYPQALNYWHLLFTAKNRPFASAAMPLGCNSTLR